MASQPQGIADDYDVNQILRLSARYRVCNSFPLPAHAVLSPEIRLACSLPVRVPVLNTSSSFSAWCAYDMAPGTVEIFGDLLAPATSLLVQPDVVSHRSGFFALNQMLEMQKVCWVTTSTPWAGCSLQDVSLAFILPGEKRKQSGTFSRQVWIAVWICGSSFLCVHGKLSVFRFRKSMLFLFDCSCVS